MPEAILVHPWRSEQIAELRILVRRALTIMLRDVTSSSDTNHRQAVTGVISSIYPWRGPKLPSARAEVSAHHVVQDSKRGGVWH